MPELWEQCNGKSGAMLGYLFKLEYGYYPEWDERSGKQVVRPNIINAPDYEEDHIAEVNREISRPPGNRRDGLDD